MVARPAFSGTMRARRTKKEQHSVNTKQWLGYIAVAVATTWLTQSSTTSSTSVSAPETAGLVAATRCSGPSVNRSWSPYDA